MTKKVEKAEKSAQTKKATKAVSVSLELSPEAQQILSQFRDAKKAEALAKEQKELAELALREVLGTHLEGTFNGAVVVKVVNGKNTHFDREMMKELFPEAYEATLKETLYNYLKTL
jgi:hypothetical protein